MVKDIKYIIKRILIGVGIALVIGFLKGGLIADVHASTSRYTLYSNDYSVLWSNSITTNQTINVQNVSRIRINFTDAIAQNSTYQITLKIDVTALDHVPYYNPSNIFVGGAGQTCEVATVSSTITPQGSSSFLREAVITYTFKANATSSDNFWEGQLAHVSRITYLNATISVTKIADNTGEQIVNSTQDIINNNNNNTTNIINNQNNNTNQIINNQNENSEKEIKSQRVCKKYDKSNIYTDGKYLVNNGTYVNDNNYGITNYIKISSDTSITSLTTFNSLNANYCFYDINKDLISCSYINSLSQNTELSIPTNASYFRSSVSKAYNKPSYNVCNNGNQALNDSINETNDTLKDDSVDNPSSDITSMNSKLASNGVITQLLTLPVTLYQSVLNNINGSCSPFNLGSLFNHNLSMPCINLESLLGSSLWNIIDILCCGLFILSFRKRMVDIFNHMSSLKDGGNELE